MSDTPRSRSQSYRKRAGEPYVTVTELLDRLGITPDALDTYVAAMQSSPIFTPRFEVAS